MEKIIESNMNSLKEFVKQFKALQDEKASLQKMLQERVEEVAALKEDVAAIVSGYNTLKATRDVLETKLVADIKVITTTSDEIKTRSLKDSKGSSSSRMGGRR